MTRIRRKNYQQEKSLWSDFYEAQKKQHKEGKKETPELKKARLHKLKWITTIFVNTTLMNIWTLKTPSTTKKLPTKF